MTFQSQHAPDIAVYLSNVLLDHTVFSCLDVLGVLEHKNALPLAATFWLGDKGFIFLAATECLEISIAAHTDDQS